MSSSGEFPAITDLPLPEPTVSHVQSILPGHPTVPDDILGGRQTLKPEAYALMNDLPEEQREACRKQIEHLLGWMGERLSAGRSFDNAHYDVLSRCPEMMTIQYDETLQVGDHVVGVRFYQLKIQKYGEHLPIDFSCETVIRDGIHMDVERVDFECKPKTWREILALHEQLTVDN